MTFQLNQFVSQYMKLIITRTECYDQFELNSDKYLSVNTEKNNQLDVKSVCYRLGN